MTRRLLSLLFCFGLLAGILPYPVWTVAAVPPRAAAGTAAAPCCCQPGKCRMPACPANSSGTSAPERTPKNGCALSACHPTVVALDGGKGLFTFTFPRAAVTVPAPPVRPAARARRAAPVSAFPAPPTQPPRMA